MAERIDGADCLIAFEPCFKEGSLISFTSGLPPATTIYVRRFSVTIGNELFEGVVSSEVIERLLERSEARIGAVAFAAKAKAKPDAAPADVALTQNLLWSRIEDFLKPGDVVIAENGTSSIALGDLRFPSQTKFISQMLWGSIGYSLPALLGSNMAAPERRHLLFIGDGSFQMTAQELSTILRLKLKPIIFLLNNRGYTIERYILGMRSAYNDVANWKYADLTKVFCSDTDALSLSVSTASELGRALDQAEVADRLVFIEVHLDLDDAPEALKVFGPKVAEFDYGPRGPQATKRSHWRA